VSHLDLFQYLSFLSRVRQQSIPTFSTLTHSTPLLFRMIPIH
jgi:hypothetical protein